MTVSDVRGFGAQGGSSERYAGEELFIENDSVLRGSLFKHGLFFLP